MGRSTIYHIPLNTLCTSGFPLLIFQKCRIQHGRIDADGANIHIEFTENSVRAKCRTVVAGFGGVDWWRGGTLLRCIIAQHRRIRLHLVDTAILNADRTATHFDGAATKLQSSTSGH